MTVSTDACASGPYEGDGVCTQFRVDFPFLEVSHLLVMLMDYDQSKQLELGVDYTVGNINASTGDVYLNQPLKPGQSLIIKRNVPFTQLADYVQGDAFPAEIHEMALDKLTMMAQQLKDGVDRAIKVSDEERSGFQFPAQAVRKNKLLGFDAQEGLPQAVDVGTGLRLENGFIQVQPHIGIVTNENGVSVLYGDGLGVYDHAIVVKLGEGLEFDDQAKIQIQNEIISTIQGNTNGLLELQGLVANLSKRVAELELTGGGEVAIYIGNGLQYDEQGNLTIKPNVGIKVDTHGVSVMLGDGLDVNAHGEVMVSQSLQDSIANKAERSELTALKQTVGQLAIPGQVIYAAFQTPPAGWLVADGREISRTVYSKLFEAIGTAFGEGDGSATFNLPDLRGEFIRGWDAGRGLDSDRAFGSVQGDAMRKIVGSFAAYSYQTGNVNGVFSSSIWNSGVVQTGNAQDSNYIGYTFDSSRNNNPTATENRPRNMALMAFIYAGF